MPLEARKPRGKKEEKKAMESKNKTILMTLIDAALEEITWVQPNGESISLKGAIAKSIKMGRDGRIESLSRDDLLGADTARRIETQDFAGNSRDMKTQDIAEKIKEFVLDRAHAKWAELMEAIDGEEEGQHRKVG